MIIRILKILTILLLVFLPFFLFHGYKALKEKVIFFLSNPVDLESVIIVPHDFQGESLFDVKWSSISILMDGSDLLLKNPKISLHPLLARKRELLNISIDSVHVNINPQKADSSTHDSVKTTLEHINQPDFWLPFRASVNVNKVSANIKNVGKWALDSLIVVKSGLEKSFFVKASNIRGSHLKKNLFLRANYKWNESFSDASIGISDKSKDSILVTLNAPRTQLEDLSAELSASIDNISLWLKDKWPSGAPNIEKITLHSNLSANILTQKLNFDLSLQTTIGEVWQLPSFSTSIKALGNNNGIFQSNISLNGKNGESVKFNGNINKNLDGNGELEVSGINIVIANQTLPTDIKFHRIIKRGDAISAHFTTGAGSNFNAKIADLNNPIVMFEADVASNEPWAVQWTKDMVKLAEPTILTGSFSFREIMLRANLKTKVPFAYYASADELDVSLWLDADGIRFPRGTIKRNGYESVFDGRVMWNDEYFTFKLHQESKGIAEIHGTLTPKIDLKLQNLNTVELPFADTAMLKGYNGIVSGNWVYDIENRIGKANVALSTVIQNLSINAKSDVEILRDSLLVENFEIEQADKKISGFMFAMLPSETRKKFEIQKARINIPNMNLVSLLATVNDSTLASGNANGSLEFDKINGLRGDIAFSQIAIRGLDSNIAKFPNLHFKALGDVAKISSHVFLGQDGFWNGNFEAGISKLGQQSNLPVYISYAVKNIDNMGTLTFDGSLSKDFKNVSGNAKVQGNWFLPGGVGEITNANLNISAKTVLGKNALDSLSASFNATNNNFEKSILKVPFSLNGRIRNKMLMVDSAFVYGQNDEKITAKLQFNLENTLLRDLSFKTEQFTLFLLNEHWIKIRNGSGKTRLDSDGITVFAEFPSISYRMESAEYGTAHATIQGEAAFRVPSQTEVSQTNSSITGNFEISKASYTKRFELLPDPWHLDRTFKNAMKFLSSLMKEKKTGLASERQALTGRPTTLNVRLQTRGLESATINSNVVEFPFAVNVSILGTTRNVLLSGDINAVAGGKIGYQDLAMFDLSSFRLYWHNVPLRQGEIELRASNNYPFCFSDKLSEETCTLSMNINGPLSGLNMQPSASCNIEASPALLYYSMLLGCISENNEYGSIDGNKFIGKVAGWFLSSAGNKILGDNIIGDIDMKWDISNEVSQKQDTNYIRIPFSLSKWIPNLEAVFGYSDDISADPRYDKSYEIGLRYMFDVFDSSDINTNFIDPSLSINTNLVARSYQTGSESDQNETRLEKNIGLAYKHRFWEPSIFGIGRRKKE